MGKIKFKAGDKVIIRKPNAKNPASIGPGWLSSMNKYDGRQITLTQEQVSSLLMRNEIFHGPWYFSGNWLELAEDPAVEKIYKNLKQKVSKKT